MTSRLLRALLRLCATGVLLLVVLPQGFAWATGRTCAEYVESRPPVENPVTAEEVRAASQGVRELRVPYLPLSFDGVALPGAVLFDRKPDGILWYHEMIHLAQLENDGHVRYAYRYLSDWYRGRLNGCGFHAAYMSIRYEREAYALSASLTFIELVGYAQTGGDGLFTASRMVDEGRRKIDSLSILSAAVAAAAEQATTSDDLAGR